MDHPPSLTHAERQMEWNNTHVPFPEDACLHHFLEARAQQSPDSIALIFKDQQLTYGELNRRSNQLAHYLQSLGVGPDVPVAIFIERSLEMAIGLYGVLKAGGVYVPVDPNYPGTRVAFMIEDTRVPVILTQESLLDTLPTDATHPPHQARVVAIDADWEKISRESEENPKTDVTANHLAYTIYTSGSTGQPKGAMLNHRGRVNNFLDFNRRYDIGPDDRLLGLASLSFDMSAYDIFGMMATGGRTIIVEKEAVLNPARWAELMVEHKITVWHSVPALLEMLVNQIEPRPSQVPHSLRLVLLGGDWIPVTLPDRLKALIEGVHTVSMGGATEVSMDSTIYDIVDPSSEWKSIPYGVPMANQLTYVLDENLEPLPPGTPGELFLGGVGVGRGYLNRQRLTAEKFIPNPFSGIPGDRMYRTGDLARYFPDGNLELLGRIDFQVKIRGFRVELGEIEASLREHPAVKEAVVLARQDDRRQGGGRPDGTHPPKHLVAYLLQDPAYTGSSEEEAQNLQDTQVDQWQMVYETAYSRPSTQDDPTFNIVSWDSSYTDQPIPAEEMREWVEYTVERIRAYKPRRVLEIGCGTGLLLFRIAPHCEKYWGTDFSKIALDHVGRYLDSQRLSNIVHLERRLADNYEGIEPGSFDAIVLNSIVVDFPSLDYLLKVLEGGVKTVAPGGIIFIGDVRSLPMLETFHTSVQLHRAQGSLPGDSLRQRIYKQMRMEEELVIDPAFFAALPHHFPEIGHVRIQLKRGQYHNEMMKFRYDVTIHIGAVEDKLPKLPEDAWLDWADELHPADDLHPADELHPAEEGLSVEAVRELLRDRKPEMIGIKRVPNARNYGDARMVEILGAGHDVTAKALREKQQEIHREQPGIEPETFWQLGEELPYSVDVQYAHSGELGYYDVILARRPLGQAAAAIFPDHTKIDPRQQCVVETPLHDYANNPLQAKVTRKLTPQLRSYLDKKLPDYMVPSAFVIMDAFPLNQNGKINRRAFPKPDTLRPDLAEAFVAPGTPVEKILAGIWAEGLGADELHPLEQIGVHDRFIALGGNSLLATQVVSRIRDIFQIDLPLSYGFNLTIAELAGQLDERGRAGGIDVHEIAEIFMQISQLSDEEARALLE